MHRVQSILLASLHPILVLQLVLISSTTTITAMTTPSPKVAVIGAGAAGMAVARVMQRAGLEQVLLLEKDVDVGGVWNYKQDAVRVLRVDFCLSLWDAPGHVIAHYSVNLSCPGTVRPPHVQRTTHQSTQRSHAVPRIPLSQTLYQIVSDPWSGVGIPKELPRPFQSTGTVWLYRQQT